MQNQLGARLLPQGWHCMSAPVLLPAAVWKQYLSGNSPASKYYCSARLQLVTSRTTEPPLLRTARNKKLKRKRGTAVCSMSDLGQVQGNWVMPWGKQEELGQGRKKSAGKEKFQPSILPVDRTPAGEELGCASSPPNSFSGIWWSQHRLFLATAFYSQRLKSA